MRGLGRMAPLLACIAGCNAILGVHYLDGGSEADGGDGGGDGGGEEGSAPVDVVSNDGAVDESVRDAARDALGDDGGPSADASLDAPEVDARDGSTVACTGEGGPAGVSVGSYCIDATEVTVAQYAVFLSADASTALEPPECAWNHDYTPGSWSAQQASPGHPVDNVNWCDAMAFCAWSGKHLCGNIGGGAMTTFSTDAGEWWNACTRGGMRLYPYGNVYEAGRCNGADSDSGGLVPAGSLTGCQGGYDGIFDMSGNAFEWINNCNAMTTGDGGANDSCVLVGGSVFFQGSRLECTYGFYQPRNETSYDIGFRCCD